ncbi:MAG: PH domain-containing protein [Patescibacteria group bacterium]
MVISHLIKQKSYERIEYVLRRHWLTFLPNIILLLVLMAVPIILYFFLGGLYPSLSENAIWRPIGVLFGSAYYLSIYLFFYMQFIDFYLDQWIVTNDRLVDIEQFGLFSRSIAELDLFQVQDVTSEVHGFFATFFNYGDLCIKTASMNLDIVFRKVPNPNHIRNDIIRLAEEDRRYHHTPKAP